MITEKNSQLSLNQGKELLSIGIPVFNEEANIEETLRSLMDQDYSNIEIIISDNNSNDATLDICQKVALLDSRIKIHTSEVNRGAGWNFQNVLSLANGDFFMWAGAHDRWKPSFASSCIFALQYSKTCVTAFPSAIFIDQHGKSLGAISTAYDTQGVSNRVRPWLTAWLLISHYAYPFYGVHRTNVIRKVMIDNECIGPDVVALFELAFFGCTAYVSGVPQIEMRKNSDYGDWSAYLRRIYNSSDINYKGALRDMRSAYWAAIKRRVKGARGRLFHYFILLLFMPVLRKLASTATKGASN